MNKILLILSILYIIIFAYVRIISDNFDFYGFYPFPVQVFIAIMILYSIYSLIKKERKSAFNLIAIQISSFYPLYFLCVIFISESYEYDKRTDEWTKFSLLDRAEGFIFWAVILLFFPIFTSFCVGFIYNKSLRGDDSSDTP